ncbi:aldo/keto reductase [Streptomyces sp. DSM 42041]|uniref:Aldo/keto reductase n=1 Tax=Streptomyces hazeniae TaxID=3075538 RepID=A0ABU2NLG9_9ACTN|nr:aldo/keto reductase [Streptomyces sp. DSM 42041]MDT0377466.1 aldo/keto reductase [Streptomyces sp. DSM 42041]
MTTDWSAVGTVRIGPDLEVRRLGFGGAWLTGPGTYGPPADPDAARAVVRRAVEAGVQLVDTADCYGPEISETLISEALTPYRDQVAVSTKGGRRALGGGSWQADGRPEHLRRACEGSLRRLRRDTIDLYQLNAVDPAVPVEESLGALVELRDAGKIRHIGVCNVTVAQLEAALAVTAVASVQERYDLTTRDHEDVLDACAARGLAFLPWFPPANALRAAPGSALARVARSHEASPAQVALAWLLRRSPVTLPLPGTTDPQGWEEDLAALRLRLSEAEVDALAAPVPPPGGRP